MDGPRAFFSDGAILLGLVVGGAVGFGLGERPPG
jgi:hypothetical protein